MSNKKLRAGQQFFHEGTPDYIFEAVDDDVAKCIKEPDLEHKIYKGALVQITYNGSKIILVKEKQFNDEMRDIIAESTDSMKEIINS